MAATDRVTLDESRDFMYTALRSMERFAAELKATVDMLQARQPGEEWLEASQTQLQKGVLFMTQQQELWEGASGRMDAYLDSVRALADEMAIKDLKMHGAAGDEQTPAEDARFIHPELHRFKLEKTAKIVGKYGGSPAFGAMVMPRLQKDQILKATASPAAREIVYSKAENKEAAHLAEVMRFKTEKKEATNALWQDEMVGRKGQAYLAEQQAKGVAAAPPLHATPLPADLANKLALRQAAVEAAEAEAVAAAAKVTKTPTSTVTGELADKLGRRQQHAADQEAAAAAEAAEAAAVAAAVAAAEGGVDDGSGPAAVSEHANPLTAELSQPRTPETPLPGGPSASATAAAGNVTPELMARFQKMRQGEDT